MSLIASLLPPSVVVREGAPKNCARLGELYPEEQRAVERAVEKRRTQYAATRHLARLAMTELGISPQPLLNAEDRSPIWPSAVVGSITHTDSWCGVALAHEAGFRGIGIDVEAAEPLSEGVAERILTAEEDAHLRREHAGQRLRLAKLYFSAKEAFYKCQYPTSQKFLGFEDVRLSFDHEVQSFEAKLLVEVPGWPDGVSEIRGRYAWGGGVVATSAICVRVSPRRG